MPMGWVLLMTFGQWKRRQLCFARVRLRLINVLKKYYLVTSSVRVPTAWSGERLLSQLPWIWLKPYLSFNSLLRFGERSRLMYKFHLHIMFVLLVATTNFTMSQMNEHDQARTQLRDWGGLG